ncbi:MAG: hypothetical protein LBH84_02890 [Prevotellaceae bacterium]|jgi:hypothetical protein|nr:hypothetical protein [Prevotellaceae bacterium]
MNEKKLVIRELKALAKQFGSIKLRYKYDEENEAHVVEVSKSFYESEDYVAEEMKIHDKLSARCPGLWVVFISDDSEVGIDDVKSGEECTIYGAGYAHSDAKPQSAFSAFRKIREKVANMAAV